MRAYILILICAFYAAGHAEQVSARAFIKYSGPVRARIDAYTPAQWQSAQQKRLANMSEDSLRRWPDYRWRYAGYHGWCWPFYGIHFQPTYVH